MPFLSIYPEFDHIDRHALFYKLSGIGVSSKMITVLRNLYTGTMWCQDGFSDHFETTMGVKQGCLLSPLLFSLLINDIDERMEGGVQIGKNVFRILAYADDLVLLATDKLALQQMINCVHDYCVEWNLKVNLTKSKVMIFRNGGKLSKKDIFRYNKEKLEVVGTYKYLGIELSSKLSLKIWSGLHSTLP